MSRKDANKDDTQTGDDGAGNGKLADATKKQKVKSLEDGTSKAEQKERETAADDAQAKLDEAKAAKKKADEALEEAQRTSRAAEEALRLRTRQAQDAANFAKNTEELVLKEGEPYKMCMVPRGFILTLDNNHRIHIKPGLRKIPDSLVDHWYVKAHGVTVQED